MESGEEDGAGSMVGKSGLSSAGREARGSLLLSRFALWRDVKLDLADGNLARFADFSRGVVQVLSQ